MKRNTLIAIVLLSLTPFAQGQENQNPDAGDEAAGVEDSTSDGNRRHHRDRHHGRRHDGTRNRPSFSDFDQDDDGLISNDEFNAFHAARIQQRSAEGRQMKNVANASRFTDIDADDDGRIDPDEFTAHQSAQRAGKRQR